MYFSPLHFCLFVSSPLSVLRSTLTYINTFDFAHLLLLPLLLSPSCISTQSGMRPLSFVSLLIFPSLSSLSHLPVSKSGTGKCIKHIVQWLATQETYPYTFPLFSSYFFLFLSHYFLLSLLPIYCYCLYFSLPACLTLHLSVSLNAGFCIHILYVYVCVCVCVSLSLSLSLC